MTVLEPLPVRTAPAPEGLLLSDCVLDTASGLRIAPDAGTPAGYLDGAEARLLELLGQTSDRSVGSPELRRHVRDWPSLYHLTPYRSTILECFGWQAAADARVLELGAGCGAITRWLGEHLGTIDAVEGNADRATVARARCADLANVALHCANYSQLAESDAYDVATLIGVLEYGHLYHPVFRDSPEDAALDNLRVARRALHDDGVLVLAIENRLGLKYINGAPEDHSGRLFEGIQGYPHASSAVTFSALALRELLASAGFAEAAFFLPYPDYKLASTIVNAAHAGAGSDAHNWLPGWAPGRGGARGAVFSEALAERELARAGLLPEMANSFLVLAFAGERSRAERRLGLQTEWSARHFALDRRPGLRKRVTIGPPADPQVRHEPLPGEAPLEQVGVLRHRFADEPRCDGEGLVFRAHEAFAAAAPDGLMDALLRESRAWLLKTFATGWVDHSGVALLEGEAFDATWWNIICGADDKWQWIDREWSWCEPIPVDFVLWRTLVGYAERFGQNLPERWRRPDSGVFADEWLRRVEPDLDEARLRRLRELEHMSGRSAELGEEPTSPPAAGGLVSVTASLAEILEQPELISHYLDAFGPEDSVALVLHTTPERAGLVEELQAHLVATGRDDAALPTLLLRVTADATAEGRARAACCAQLTRQPAGDDDEGAPRVSDVSGLRRIVEHRLQQATANMTSA